MSGGDYAKMSLPVEEIGRALAHCDDDAQAHLLNAWGCEMYFAQTGVASWIEMKQCAIARELDLRGREFVLGLAEIVALLAKEKAEREKAEKEGGTE